MQSKLKYLLLLVIIFHAVSCEIYKQDEFEGELSVEAYLVAEEPFKSLHLTAITPFEAVYDFNRYAVSDAEITIYKLDLNGNRIKSYPLYESGKGRYSSREEFIPRPRYSYELHAITSEKHNIRAYTTIPDTFRVKEMIRDSVVYHSDNQVQVLLTQSWYPDRQSFYILRTYALSTEEYAMTPFYHTDDEDTRRHRRRTRSDIFTEKNYQVHDDGTITMKYPWQAISWFGPNEVTIHAIDNNIYDYYRSQDVQTGVTSQPPGHIDNIISNVDGGHGLFGGMSVVRFEIYVDYPPGFDPSDLK